MTDDETIRVYNTRAADYAALVQDDDTADPDLATFIAACPAGGRVLDLGCGPGTAAVKMAKAGLQVEAIDASAEMIALASQHNGVQARVGTFDDIEGDQIYDGIWASFCLLHAPRSRMADHLSALHTALKPGGVFFIGMKLGTGTHRDDIGRQYTYYAQDELMGQLQNAGFTPHSHRLGSSKGLDGTMADWIVIHAHG